MLKTRKDVMERQRAIDTARNVLSSRVGLVVMDENKFPERTLQLQMKRIDSEQKKNQTRIENDKKLFKKERLIYNFEPTIVVERQPAADSDGQFTYVAALENVPSYMRPRNPQYLAPSGLPSIDAFTVKAKKKVNLWEGRSHEENYVAFRSILMASPPLSQLEKLDLEKGWKIHRPVSRLEELMRKRLDEKLEGKRSLLRSLKAEPPAATDTVFITQQFSSQTAADKLPSPDPEERSAEENPPAPELAPSGDDVQLEKKISFTFDERKLETFDRIRERQKQKYHNQF